MRTVQEAAAVVGGDLEEEGVLEVLPPGVAPQAVVAMGVGADGLQAALQQRPMRRHARAQLHLEYHEAPPAVRRHVACTDVTPGALSIATSKTRDTSSLCNSKQ